MKSTGTHVLEHEFGMPLGSLDRTPSRPATAKAITLGMISSPVVHWNLTIHPPLPLRALLVKLLA